MNDVLKMIFNHYFEDEFYTTQILNDSEYLNICNKIEENQNKLLNLLDKTIDNEEILSILDEFENLYMSMANTFRYYDFTQGLCIGIALSSSSLIINPQFMQDILKLLNDYYKYTYGRII